MRLLGANPAPRVLGAEELPGKANYFIGNDPSQWRTNVPTYAKVRHKDVYPGIDLVYYGHQGQFEYDFAVAPGTDPRSIRLAFAGGGKASIDKNGDLLLRAASGEVRFQKPVVYQNAGGVREPVEGSYVMATAKRADFALENMTRASRWSLTRCSLTRLISGGVITILVVGSPWMWPVTPIS